MAANRSDLMLGLGLDASGALKEAQRLADKMRQELGGAGVGGARSADEIAKALKRATDAANSTGRAMGGIGPGGAAAAARSADDLADALRRTDADAARARRSLDDLTGSAKELAIGLAAGIGAALAGGALAGWIGQAADAADEVARLADQTGISAEKLSAWGNVAQRNGQDLNDLAELTTEMSLRLSEIDKDSEGAGLALKNLGLDYKALAAMPAEEAFEAIARSVASTENSGRKTALVMAALGDEAQKYITTLNTIGAAGQMEAIVTAQQAAAAREYKDALNGVSAASAAWSQSIVSGILPALSEAARALDDVMSGTGGLTSEARRLAQDGSITDWARAGVTALTYLADAGSVVVRAFKIVGHTIAADAAIAGEAFSALGSAAKLALSGDFAGAAETVRSGMARVKSISADASVTLDGMWSEKTLGAKIRERMEQTKAYTAAAQTAAKVSVSGRSMIKQEAPKAGQGAAEAVALAKAQAQAALAAEIDATNAIRKELERRHSLGLDASGDYYRQLADLAARESKAKLAAIDAEAAAEKARATKDPASAKQSEARLIEIATRRAQEVAAAREKAADIGAQAEREALDESRRIAQEWAQSWQAADKMAQQYASASAKAQAAMITDPLERARAEAEITAQQIARDGAQMMADLGNQIDMLTGAGLTAQADTLRVKLDQIRAGIAAEQERTRAAPGLEFVNDYLKESPGQKIAEGFDAASQSLSAFATGFKSLFDLEQNYSKAMSERGLTAQKIAEIEAAHSAQQVNAYGTLAGAAKGFFKQGSSGYKALQTAEKAFRSYELAMSIKNASVKMGLISAETSAKLSGYAESAIAAVKSGATQIASLFGIGTASAAAGVANQAQGDPYTAFPRMAAMAALMAGLGFAVKGGGGSNGGNPSAADRQAATGTGTVLGDETAKSESIANSIDALTSVDTLTMQYSAQMLASLRSIEASMAGVSTQILRAGGITTGANLGIQTGTISRNQGDPILSAIGGGALNNLMTSLPVVGGIISGLQRLWGKTSAEITDAGLALAGTVAQMRQGGGVSQYADVRTTTSSWFGLSKKTSNSTQMADVSDEMTRQFGLIFGNVGESLQAAAGAMGQDAAAVGRRLAGYVIEIPRLSLKGLSGDALQEAVATAVGAKADEMARMIAPGLVDFQRIGEGYYETVVRVASSTEQAGEVLRSLGIAQIDASRLQRKQADDMTAELVRESITLIERTSGGMSTAIGQIVATMSGSAEDIAAAYRKMRDARSTMQMMGMPGEGLTRSTISGAGGLDALQSAMSDFEAKFFTDAERASFATQRMQAEFTRLGVAMPATMDGFRSLITGMDTSGEAGQMLQGQLLLLSGGFADLMSATEEAATAVASLTDNQRAQVAATLAQIGIGRGADAQTAAAAAGGLDALQTGMGDFEKRFFSDSEQFSIQAGRLSAQFKALGVSMPTSADEFRGLVSGVDATSEAGSKLLGGLLPLSSGFADLMDRMGQLKTATSSLGKGVEDEVNRIRGVIGQRDGQSVAGAQAAFTVATAQARAGDAKALEALPGLSQALLKSAEEQAATRADVIRIQAQTAASLQATLDAARGTASATIPAFASGGDHMGGLRLVGENGPELEATGPSRIFNAGQTAAMLSGGGGSSAMLAELQALRSEAATLRAEVQAMRAETTSGLTAVATHTRRSAVILDRVTAGGDTVQTEVVT